SRQPAPALSLPVRSAPPHPDYPAQLDPARLPERKLDMTSVFAPYQSKAWPHRFAGAIKVGTIAGGIPTDEHVAESWLRTKLADKDDLIREAVATTMLERGISADE